MQPENTGSNRDEKGRFIKGVSGNPDGKPIGAFSLIAILKQKLQECPKGMSKKEKRTYAILLIEKMLTKAIKEGDNSTHRLILNYMEGMPKQAIEHSGEIIQKVDDEELKDFILWRKKQKK